MQILMLSADAQMIDRRILQEARTLANTGHNVTLLSGFECTRPDAYRDGQIVVKRYTYDWRDRRYLRFTRKFGRHRYVSAIGWRLFRFASYLAKRPNAFEAFVLEKIDEHRFDVIHIHDFPMLRIGAIVARARRVPLIYDSHEFYPIQSELPAAVQKRYLKIEKTYICRCSAVITVNPYLAKMMADAYGIPQPQVILNAAEYLSIEPAPLRTELGLSEEDLLILYQGWVAHNRNIEVIIEAMRFVPPNVKFLLVGYGEHLGSLKTLARERGLEQRVIFYGRVESGDLPPVTAACDIGVIPYVAVDEMHKYCSPNKLFEFIMAEIPIIASDLPYLRDIILKYGLGLVGDLSSPRVLARLISELSAAPELRIGMRMAARRAKQELNWTIEGKKLVDIYRRVLPVPHLQPTLSKADAAGG